MDRNVANTLSKPDLHQAWIENYRSGEADRFNAETIGYLLKLVRLPAGSKVLDAGCGSGTNSVRLATAGLSVTGVDFSAFALERARENAVGLPIDLQQGDLTNLPFQDGSFDAVFCIGVLMHIPDLKAVVSELVRITKPGGCIVLAETNESSLEMLVYRLYWKLKGHIKVERTPLGTETWAQTQAGPLLARKLKVPAFIRHMEGLGTELRCRHTGEATELYNTFANPFLKTFFHRINALWFKMGGSPRLSTGNLLVFNKRPRACQSAE